MATLPKWCSVPQSDGAALVRENVAGAPLSTMHARCCAGRPRHRIRRHGRLATRHVALHVDNMSVAGYRSSNIYHPDGRLTASRLNCGAGRVRQPSGKFCRRCAPRPFFRSVSKPAFKFLDPQRCRENGCVGRPAPERPGKRGTFTLRRCQAAWKPRYGTFGQPTCAPGRPQSLNQTRIGPTR
jgi:hypothetical protein